VLWDDATRLVGFDPKTSITKHRNDGISPEKPAKTALLTNHGIFPFNSIYYWPAYT